MKVWLGWVFILVTFCTASAQNCASDETGPGAGNCTCNTTMYTPAQFPPQPALQCLSGQMKLNVSKCQLEASKYNSSSLHLIDPNCGGIRQVDGIAMIVVNTSTSSSTCGTSMTLKGTYLTYSNTLYILPKSYGGLYVRGSANFTFNCSYLIDLPISLATAWKPILGVTDITLPGGVGSATVVMSAYIDPSYTTAVTTSTTLNVQDPLYITVLVPDLDATAFAVKVIRVYAAATNDANATVQYDLIINGCPVPDRADLVTIEQNGATNEARIKIAVFQISGESSVYLFAVVQICKANCTVTCPAAGSTRDLGQDSGTPASVSAGPFESDPRISGAAERFSWVWTINTLLLSLLGARLL